MVAQQPTAVQQPAPVPHSSKRNPTTNNTAQRMRMRLHRHLPTSRAASGTPATSLRCPAAHPVPVPGEGRVRRMRACAPATVHFSPAPANRQRARPAARPRGMGREGVALQRLRRYARCGGTIELGWMGQLTVRQTRRRADGFSGRARLHYIITTAGDPTLRCAAAVSRCDCDARFLAARRCFN